MLLVPTRYFLRLARSTKIYRANQPQQKVKQSVRQTLKKQRSLTRDTERATNVPTLSACYNFERRYKENSKVLMANELIKKQYESAINGNKAKEGIKLVADLMFKNSADMGFINASKISATLE